MVVHCAYLNILTQMPPHWPWQRLEVDASRPAFDPPTLDRGWHRELPASHDTDETTVPGMDFLFDLIHSEPFVLHPMYLLWLLRFPRRPFYLCYASGRCVLRWSVAQCVVLPYVTVRAARRWNVVATILQDALVLCLLLLLSGDIGEFALIR